MKGKYRLGPVLLVFWLLSSAAAGQAIEGFAEYVQQAVQDWEVPGLAVAVVKDGQTLFLKGYGVRSLESGEPVDPDTRFAAASTTKAMTAAALGMLVDEGKLKWDAPVHEILPQLQLHDPWMTRELTVRDLLTHRAGLGNADFLWYGQDTPAAEILYRIRFAPLAYSPRSGFIYQNIMYGAAGEVVAALSGKTWEEFVQRRIFEPLDMNRTVPTKTWLEDQSNYTQPHHFIDGRIQVITTDQVASIPAAGAVWSSARDMARWMTFLLNGGVAADGRRLLKEATLEELFRPQVILELDDFYPTAKLTKPHWMTYGLGWFQHDYHGRKVDFHTGSIDGLVAIVGLIREKNVGICVLGNLDHAELRHALMYRVFDRFLSLPSRDWSAELKPLYAELRRKNEERVQKLEAARVQGTSPSLPLSDYAGEYRDPLYGTARVSLQGDQLRVQVGDHLYATLNHWHYDTFRLVWDRKWIGKGLATFALSSQGRVESVSLGNLRLEKVQPEAHSDN